MTALFQIEDEKDDIYHIKNVIFSKRGAEHAEEQLLYRPEEYLVSLG